MVISLVRAAAPEGGRSENDAEGSMIRRCWRIAFLILILIAGLVAYVITCTPISTWVFGLGAGSPAFAEKWRARLQPIGDPDSATALYSDIEVVRFKDGDWVIGVSDDSHASPWGGTVVVKDSTGATRAFFGHVCGPGFLSKRLSKAPFTGGILQS
jgi:hypothetical protein